MRIKNRVPVVFLVFLTLIFVGSPGIAALAPEGNVVMLPMNCAELLPDDSPYLNFFDAVGRGQATANPALSESIYRILALRNLLAEKDERSQMQNPVDALIRKTLCYYREQKEPRGSVSFDDPAFVTYLKGAMKELEASVDKAIIQAESDRQERLRYEKKLMQNQKYVEGLRRKAQTQASRIFQKLRDAVGRKLRQQPN